MADFPDIYADGFSVSAGRFGVTLTLTRSEPTGEPGARCVHGCASRNAVSVSCSATAQHVGPDFTGAR